MGTVELNNGVKMPLLGFGVFQITDQRVCEQSVLSALQTGYRMIDTAACYGNERAVGTAIQKSGIERKEIFLVSKVWIQDAGYEKTKKSFEKTLHNLQMDYLDLYLIHMPFGDYHGSWKAMEELYREGKVKAIGVSNFLIDDLENLIAHCEIKPMVNQLLIHIGNTPAELIAYCKEQDIVVEAYSPIAHGEALKNETIVAMAEKYGVSVPQLCIKYVLNLGTVALPKTANVEHMQNNANLNFEISNEDMDALKALNFRDYGEYSFFPVFSGK